MARNLPIDPCEGSFPDLCDRAFYTLANVAPIRTLVPTSLTDALLLVWELPVTASGFCARSLDLG